MTYDPSLCNYCQTNPPEPGQVVCRACMDRIPPWEAT